MSQVTKNRSYHGWRIHEKFVFFIDLRWKRLKTKPEKFP